MSPFPRKHKNNCVAMGCVLILLIWAYYRGFWHYDQQTPAISVDSERTPNLQAVDSERTPNLQAVDLRIPTPITIVVVLCGQHATYSSNRTVNISNNMRELKTLIKSLLLTEYNYLMKNHMENIRRETLEIIIYLDNSFTSMYIDEFFQDGREIAPEYLRLARFRLKTARYPKKYLHLKNMLYPCATFRLLLGLTLPKHDAILYLDTDVILRKNARLTYNEVYEFNESQWCGMAPAMYHTKKYIPFYGVQGLSSGVGVYNLTRMRRTALLADVPIIYDRFKLVLPDADQDILNVYFHSRPEEVRQLDCGHNYIQYYCFPSPTCDGPSQNGINAIHGCSEAFFPPEGRPRSQYSIIFDAYEELDMSTVLSESRLQSFQRNLRSRLEANQEELQPGETLYETSCTKNPYFIQNLFMNMDV